MAEGSFSLDRGELMHGRLLWSSGEPCSLHPEDLLLARAFARPSNPDMDPLSLNFELQGDGSFELSLRPHSPVQDLSQLEEVLILVTELASLPSGWASNSKEWAFVPVGELTENGVDLGEVHLGRERALLAVHVSDMEGNPVQHARVRLDYETAPVLGSSWRPVVLHGGGEHTGEEGVAYLVGFDFDQAVEGSAFHDKKTGRMRIRAEHLHHSGAEVVVDQEEQEAQVTLGPGNSIQGAVRIPQDLRGLEIFAVDPGAGPDRWGEFRGPSIEIQTPEDAAEASGEPVVIPFTVQQLDAELYDLVVFATEARRVVQRVAGIQVKGATQLPEALDLVPAFDRYEFKIVLPDGKPVTQARARREGLHVHIQHSDGRGANPGWTWTGNSFVYYALRGVTDPRWLTGHQLKSIPISNWSPGVHTVRFSRFDRIYVRYSNPHRKLFSPAPVAGWHRVNGVDSPNDLVEGDRRGADRLVEIPGPGQYKVSFFLPGEGQVILSSAEVLVEITAEQIAADEIIEIEVPAALYRN